MLIEASKSEWESFEKRVKFEASMQNITCVRQEQKLVNIYGNKPIKVKSAPDYICGIDGRFVMFDAKVTKERMWNLKKHVLMAPDGINEWKKNKIHQWEQLLSAQALGNLSGYLIWFMDYGKISWVPVSAIEAAIKRGDASIHPESPFINSQKDETQVFFRKLIFGEA